MCNYPYSNRDAFQFFSSCHIYIPIAKFIYSLHVIGGFICVCYGLMETKKRSRKDIPLSCALSGFLLGGSYFITLLMDITFANHNLFLNIIHPLARTIFWFNMNLNTCRKIEVITKVDKYLHTKSSHLPSLAYQVTYYSFLFYFPLELLSFILPSIFSSINFVSFVASVSMIILPMNSFFGIYFSRKLVLLIEVMGSGDMTSYTSILNSLKKLYREAYIGLIFGELFALFWIIIPIFNKNLYVIYNILMLLNLYGSSLSLYLTRHDHQNNNVSKHDHKKKIDSKKNDKKSGSQKDLMREEGKHKIDSKEPQHTGGGQSRDTTLSAQVQVDQQIVSEEEEALSTPTEEETIPVLTHKEEGSVCVDPLTSSGQDPLTSSGQEQNIGIEGVTAENEAMRIFNPFTAAVTTLDVT